MSAIILAIAYSWLVTLTLIEVKNGKNRKSKWNIILYR